VETGDRTRRVVTSAICLALVAIFALTACSSSDRQDIGFGATDVERIDVYLYDYSASPSQVRHGVIEDRRDIYGLVEGFTDVPVQALSQELEGALVGAPAAGLRFVLFDGRSVEITQVAIAPKSVVLFWPGGSVVETEWGSPIGDYVTASEDASPEEWPAAELP